MKIYNSLKRKKEEFKPLKKGRVSMYVCGPTVYDVPHIGHARSAYIFDVIRRYLKYRKLNVTFVRNVTDVDDKIINKAKEEFKGEDINKACEKVSRKYLDIYHKDMEALDILPPDKEPKATDYIKKMQKFIAQLIKNDVAYEVEGDVYFDITKAKDYGKLSGQNLDDLKSGTRIQPGENKKNVLDFALWKKAKEGEPSWPSPWGKGRPGWHIECSVMSSDILGNEFDIHGGGIDLIFPHHENEIAQSEGAGNGFAKNWIHNGLLTINGQKMSKSLGNFVTIKDALKKYNPNVLKLFFLSAHYSSPIDFSEKNIEDTKKAYERIEILLHKLDRKFGTRDLKKLPKGAPGNIKKFRENFIEAMDNNFNTPAALAVLFNIVSECNRILDDDDNHIFMVQHIMQAIIEFGSIFGLSFKFSREKSDTWITFAIARREDLRKQKKYSEADQVRKMLLEKGIILEDTKEGITWRRKI